MEQFQEKCRSKYFPARMKTECFQKGRVKHLRNQLFIKIINSTSYRKTGSGKKCIEKAEIQFRAGAFSSCSK